MKVIAEYWGADLTRKVFEGAENPGSLPYLGGLNLERRSELGEVAGAEFYTTFISQDFTGVTEVDDEE